MKRYFFLFIYYGFIQYLPGTTTPLLGAFFRKIRKFICKNIFLETGLNINIDRKAYFGNGKNIRIGNNSGIGPNCHIPNNITIGKDVMMAPNVLILNKNHGLSNTEIPMRLQKSNHVTKLKIEDDVWIGRNVIILPSVTEIKKGSVIGAGSVVTRNIQEFDIVGGNPAKVIKNRL